MLSFRLRPLGVRLGSSVCPLAKGKNGLGALYVKALSLQQRSAAYSLRGSFVRMSRVRIRTWLRFIGRRMRYYGWVPRKGQSRSIDLFAAALKFRKTVRPLHQIWHLPRQAKH